MNKFDKSNVLVLGIEYKTVNNIIQKLKKLDICKVINCSCDIDFVKKIIDIIDGFGFAIICLNAKKFVI